MGKVLRLIKNNQPLTYALLGKKNNNNDINWTKTPLSALIDTGATQSCISQRVIDELDLKPFQKTKIITASHNNQDSYVYNATIGISLNERAINTQSGWQLANDWVLKDHQFNGLNTLEQQGIDMIIGMDIIMDGHLTISDKTLIFSI